MLLSNKKLRTGCTQNQISTESTPLSSSFNPINHTTVNVTALVAYSQNLTVLASSVLPQTNLSLRPEQQMLDSKTEPPDNNHLTVDDSNEDHEIVELDSAELLVCEICEKGFKRDTNLRMHMRAHENKFKTLEALAKPLDYGSTHRSSRRFSCLFEDDDDGQQHEEIDSSFTHNYKINSDDIVPSYDFEPIRSLPEFSPKLVSSFKREFLSELVVRVTQSPSSSESAVIHGLKCLSPLLINRHSVHWADTSLLFNFLLVLITDSRYKVREQSQLFLRDVLISFQKSSLLASASKGTQIMLDRFLLLARGANATANAGKETMGAQQVLYILDTLIECFVHAINDGIYVISTLLGVSNVKALFTYGISTGAFHVVEQQTWADLPVELLELIFSGLIVADNIRASIVCKTWHSVATSVCQVNQSPWLMYLPQNGNSYGLFDPVNRKTYSLEFPQLDRSRVFYSKDGWLLVYRWYTWPESSLFFFFNPFTRELIKLPEFEYPSSVAAFSGDPTSTECVIFTIKHVSSTIVAISTCYPGAFHDVAKNVVVFSVGNDGPVSSTTMNVAPWSFTVSASGKQYIKGASLSKGLPSSPTHIIYPLLKFVLQRISDKLLFKQWDPGIISPLIFIFEP